MTRPPRIKGRAFAPKVIPIGSDSKGYEVLQREVRIAINGFGRIGRALMRVLQHDPSVKVVHINDPMSKDQAAYLLRFDSVMGRWLGTVTPTASGLEVIEQHVAMTHELDVRGFDWKALGVDFVVNSSGVNNDRASLDRIIANGAKRVFISAPAPGVADAHILMGVNNMELTRDARIISGGSCTAHCFAPVIEALSLEYKVLRGFMQTIHATTSSQNLHDGPHPTDPRRGRAASNIVPTTTEAIKAFEAALPKHQGLLRGMAMRVPVLNGSNVDLVLQLDREVSREEINEYLKLYADMRQRKIVEFSEDPLVSSDIVGNPHSCVIDSLLTDVHGPLVRLFLWYDNEWGYANRLAELIQLATYLR